MALSFSSSTGNLFNRLGKLGLLLKQLRSYHTSQNTNFSDTANGAVAQFNGETDIQAAIGSSYLGTLTSAEAAATLAASIAESTVNRIVFRDNPRVNQTLTTFNTLASLKEVIRQMKVSGASVLAMTITAVPTAFSGNGNGGIITSIRRPLDGLVMENAFAETILVTCTSDSYVGGATAGNEGFSATGAGAQSSLFAFNWPLGSNSNVILNAIDGNTDNGSGNILTNSGFETWTVSNTPDSFVIGVGTSGVNIFRETSLVYDKAGALRITGDSGATLIRLTQKFNDATGTSGTLNPLTQYGFNVFMRRDGTAAAAGVLTIDLVDANGTIINDANAAANSFTIDLTLLSTIYTSFTGVFRTPEVLPTSQFLRLRLTTALTNGRSVYLDKMSLGVMSQLGSNETYLSIYAGSNPFTQNDFATIAKTNSRGSGGVLDTFQTLFYRLFPDVRNNELLLPSSATPSISDSNLIA